MNVRRLPLRLLLAAPLVGAALAAGAAPAAAQPVTLNAYCTPGPVPPGWGSVPGRVGFTNRVLTGFGDGSVRTINLTGSGAGVFGPLPCAMYGGGSMGIPTDVGEIGVIPDGTSNTILIGEVTLAPRNGFGPHDTQVRLYEGDCAVNPTLRSSRAVTIADGTSNTIQFGETIKGAGCVQWDDPWVAGVGQLTVTATPEPATVALVGLGLAATAVARRRRR